MIACSRVDFPEPVFPAMSACWLVPSPSANCCSLVAPARPIGTLRPPALESDQNTSGFGAIASKGTSTRAADFAARVAAQGDREPGNAIVRRYRFGSAPLVKDSRSGLSSARLSRVLEGHIDAFLLASPGSSNEADED